MILSRTATPDDIPLIQELANRIWPQAFLTIITQAQLDMMLSKMYDSAVIRNEMTNGVIWKIVEENGTAIGYLSYSMLDSTTCKLHKIYVLPDRHGQGIGKTGLKEAARYARENGAGNLVLMVNRANAKALRAYRAFGFHEAESVDWEFSPGFMLHDYKMRLELKAHHP
jgi:diamine N-acetyltransferase